MLHSRKKKHEATRNSKSNSCEAAPLHCVQSLEHRKHGFLWKQGKQPWDQNPWRKENDKALQYHSACELSTKKRSSTQDLQTASLNPVLMRQSVPGARPPLMSQSVTAGAWGPAPSTGRTKAKPSRQGRAGIIINIIFLYSSPVDGSVRFIWDFFSDASISKISWG